jgi:hypothetical protein
MSLMVREENFIRNCCAKVGPVVSRKAAIVAAVAVLDPQGRPPSSRALV